MTEKNFVHKDFNPSGDSDVAAIKAASHALSEVIDRLCPDSPEKTKALLDAQSASMFAVSSLFKHGGK